MSGMMAAARDGAAVALLLGATFSGAQWLLRRIYGESDEPAGDN